MTREEAVKILKRTKDNSYCECDIGVALEMAIEALKAEQVTSKLKSVEISTDKGDESTISQPNGKLDLISRADAIKAVCNAQCELDVPHYPQCDQVKYCDEIKALLALPSADAVSREDYHNLLTASNDIDRALREYQEKEESASADRPQYGFRGGKIPPNEVVIKYQPKDRPSGEWVNIDNYYRLATCSNCQKVTMFEKWGEYTKPYNYCPNCGAKMFKEIK